jgi:putative phage-type endonuclease
MIYRTDITQGSSEWHEIRRGKFTASVVSKLLMGKTTQGYSDAIYKVAMERLSGKIPEGYSNAAMLRGIEMEPMAREAYEVETLTLVEEVGFVEANEWVGCSPDGLVGDDGMIQIKCPAYNTHIGYLINDEVPKDYYMQMQMEMLVAGRKWNDFVSFHPDLPMYIKRVLFDKAICDKIEGEIETAKYQVEKIIKKIQQWQEK